MTDTVVLEISAVRRDGGTQVRAALDEPTVERYAIAYRNDEPVPPPVAFFDGQDYWLAAGFHRVEALLRTGEDRAEFVVYPGTLAEAKLHAARSNARHGLPLSAEDKERAVRMYLDDPEWVNRSDNSIAKELCVSWSTVRKVRQRLTPAAAEPPKRLGKDGRERPTRLDPPQPPNPPHGRPLAREVEAAEGEPPAPEPTAHSAPAILDAEGLPVAPDSLAAFAEWPAFAKAQALVREAANLVHALAASPAGAFLARDLAYTKIGDRMLFVSPKLRDLARDLKAARPHARCPYCRRTHESRPRPDCKGCNGHGWVTRPTWDAAPEDYRAETLAIKEGGRDGGAATLPD